MAGKDPDQTQLGMELSFLKQKFPKTHDRFILRTHSDYEACLQFNLPDKTRVIFQVNFLEGYPKTSPLWTVDRNEILNSHPDLNLSTESTEEKDMQFPLVSKCTYLLQKLCALYDVQPPAELDGMIDEFTALFQPGDQEMTDQDEVVDSDDYEDYTMYEDVPDIFPEDDVTQNNDTSDTDATNIDSGLSNENRDFLEKLRIQSHKISTAAQPSSVTLSSAITTDRLLKELRDIYKSEAYKNKTYDININEDNLYSWEVDLFKVDADSNLHQDLITLTKQKKDSAIRLHVTFTATYPYQPPFVRIVSPVLTGGFVFPSGAICMELLTPQGWSSAYSLESVILQVSATLSKGGARISFESNPAMTYSMHSAQADFKVIIESHKNGWYTPPPNEG